MKFYKVKLLSKEGNLEIKVLDLLPGSCYPLKKTDLSLRITFSPVGTVGGQDTWSQPVFVKTIIKNLPLSKTTYVFHGSSFSVITRETSEFEKNFNINIKTPVLFKNCLPFDIRL